MPSEYRQKLEVTRSQAYRDLLPIESVDEFEEAVDSSECSDR